MMYCSACGKPNDDDAAFCSSCGKLLKNEKSNISYDNPSSDALYSLPNSNMRDLDISINNGVFHITGKYYLLKNMNFYSSNGKSETAYVKDYLGCGYITKRSYGKCATFVVWAIIFQIIKWIYDAIFKFSSNHYAIYADLNKFLYNLRKPVSFIYTWALIICFACLLRYILDKKKVVDISFTNKRFAVPQSLISEREVHEIKSVLEKNRNK